MKVLIPNEEYIEKKILRIRGFNIMLDSDLAELYGVDTKQLKRQVRRNIDRFPPEFMFELTNKEVESLRCQIGTLKRGEHSKYLPYGFTEHGVAQASNVLKSKRAVQVSIIIIKTFIKLKEIISMHRDLAQKLNQLERKYERHDEQIQAVFDQIREFMTVKDKPKSQIGFKKR